MVPRWLQAEGSSYDFTVAFLALGNNAGLGALKQLAHNSLVFSAMDESQRTAALASWQVAWNVFVHQLAGG